MTKVIRLKAGEHRHVGEILRASLRGKRKKMFVMMGLPGSGKSTLCDHLKALGAAICNRDDVRLRLLGSATDFSKPAEVNNAFYQEVDDRLKEGRVVVIDNINVSRIHRYKAIAAARQHGYAVTIIFVEVPVEVAIDRNNKRERKIEEKFIREMHGVQQKDGLPRRREGRLVVLHNGSDREHYTIVRLRRA